MSSHHESIDSQESDHPCVEQEFQGGIGVYEWINAENQAKDVQAESIFADSSEIKDTSTLSGQELLGQRTHDNDGVK